MEKITDEKILDYLDGTLEDWEGKLIKNAISASPILQKRLEELKQVNNLLVSINKSHTGVDFTEQVMTSLEENTPKTMQYRFSRNGLLTLIFGMVSVLALFYFHSIETAPKEIFSIVSLAPFGIDGGSINLGIFKQLFGSAFLQSIIFLYAFLVLLVFDKAVLRPFFFKRSKISYH